MTVAGDLAGASAGALAARAGHRQAAAKLYRAATKAVARAQPLFRDVRSMLVVGTSGGRAGRPFLPLDVLNDVMDCCATPGACWFAEAPAAGAGGGGDGGGSALTSAAAQAGEEGGSEEGAAAAAPHKRARAAALQP